MKDKQAVVYVVLRNDMMIYRDNLHPTEVLEGVTDDLEEAVEYVRASNEMYGLSLRVEMRQTIYQEGPNKFVPLLKWGVFADK
jgi:hypothetical protein